MRKYLDAALTPRLAFITPVSSSYVGAVQIADVYTKLLKQSKRPGATVELVGLCETLMSPREVLWGTK